MCKSCCERDVHGAACFESGPEQRCTMTTDWTPISRSLTSKVVRLRRHSQTHPRASHSRSPDRSRSQTIRGFGNGRGPVRNSGPYIFGFRALALAPGCPLLGAIRRFSTNRGPVRNNGPYILAFARLFILRGVRYWRPFGGWVPTAVRSAIADPTFWLSRACSIFGRFPVANDPWIRYWPRS